MKKNVKLAFGLMLFCVASILALQVYFSYRNFTAAAVAFKKESNEAWQEALLNVKTKHRQQVVTQFGEWLADTSYVTISSSWSEDDRRTVFTINENNSPNSEKITFQISELKENFSPINPQRRQYFIDNMKEMLGKQLENDAIIFLTPDLSRRIDKAYYQTPLNLKNMEKEYEALLYKRGITIPFIISRGNRNDNNYCTQSFSLSLRRPQPVSACFKSTDIFLLQQIWVVTVGSLLLIVITIACFWYTGKTLLTQQKLTKIKDAFISNMTHEIHTPLCSISVTAEALKKYDLTFEEQKNYIEIVYFQSQRLIQLADDILSGARLEKEAFALDDYFNIHELINSILLQGIYNGKITYLPCAGEIWIKGNKTHLERAISNVLNNAGKYTLAESLISISTAVEGSSLVIKIADNGIGVPDHEKLKIFDAFYRVHTGNEHAIKGYGLGLSYVKKVIDVHKGKISVIDNVPYGSIFIISIPYERP